MKKSVSILLWGVLVCSYALGQTSNIDSLQQEFKLALTDSAKALVLGNISWEYLNTRSSPEMAKKYIDSLFSFSQKTNNQRQIATAYYQYGVLERQKGNYDQAITFLNYFIDYHKSVNNKTQIANGLYQKAIIYDNQGEFDKSGEIYYSVLKIYEELEDPYSIATIQNALGDMLKKNNKLKEAMDNYDAALKTFTDLDAKSDIANAYYNIGGVHMKKKEYDKALDFYNKALSLDQEINSLWGMAYDYEAIGEVYSLQEYYGEALEVHSKALEIREQLQQKLELAESHTHVGTDYLKLRNYQMAQIHLDKAIKLAESIGAKSSAQFAYDKLSEVYKEMGDYRKALVLKEKYINVKDSLFNETKSKQIQELQVRFDSEKKQDAITALQKDAEISELKLKRQATIRNIIIGIALATIILSIALFNRFKYKQRVEHEAEEKRRQIEKERQRTEIEKQRVEDLQKIDKLKDEFLANTSHELRTPLNGIIGLSESLKDGVAGKLSPKVYENLDMISNSGKRLSHLVNDILDFSKLKNKDLVLIPHPVDLHATVDVVLKLSETLIRDKDLKLVNAIPETIPLVEADENRVQQILHNLIGNAIKFTEKGQVEIIAQESGEMLSISISDTGIGIAKENFETIFKSFEQADGSSQREYGGTGLGLAVSRQLVELHKGTLDVRSEVGKGSKFTFTLPKSSTNRKDLEATSKGTTSESISVLQHDVGMSEAVYDQVKGSPNHGTRILIVDDDPVNRRVLENHLSVAGYDITTVSTGQEALSYIDQGRGYDLILLDVMMPGMSGYEVCQAIREKYLTSELPIVLLTAKNRVSDLVTGFSVGANDYLTKPISKDELLSRIKTHVNLNGIHKAASRFVPTEFIKSVGREAITDVLLGDYTEKEVTVLFTDIRDYTALAETMTPQQNFKFVNAYVSKMGPEIQRNKGFVNQYLGDGIMALFPNEARHALQAAIDMQKALGKYNKRRISEGYVPIAVGMGLHTGPLVMGIIGDVSRNDPAIIADTVNTASRMEGVTKYYGANIIISENSLLTITNQDDYHFRFLGEVRAKGKDKAIGIYECIDGDPHDNMILKIKTLKEFEKGLGFFLAHEFPKASAAFDKVLRKNPNDLVAKYFVTKSAELTITGISKDGDVVNTMKMK